MFVDFLFIFFGWALLAIVELICVFLVKVSHM